VASVYRHPTPESRPLDWIDSPGEFLLFTGKGGVGKSTIASAAAVALADAGLRVLLVSTDPASNLHDLLGCPVGTAPTRVPDAPGLAAVDIDPETAADAYRSRVLGPLRGTIDPAELAAIEEQLAGQCTTEVAAFDEFSALLAQPREERPFDRIVFDTAPTGHTLRLLALATAWSDYLRISPQGASCLGPMGQLELNRHRYEATVAALRDRRRTTVVLVARPEPSSLREAARAGTELTELGVGHQRLIVNGFLADPFPGDDIATALANRQRQALDDLPDGLAHLPSTTVALQPFDLNGTAALRALVSGTAPAEPLPTPEVVEAPDLAPLDDLMAELAGRGPGVIMVMGKGGVGKTSIARAIAHGLARRGCRTHLSTTDPAGNLDDLATSSDAHLTVSRIDPATEVRRYVQHRLEAAADLAPEAQALLEEDLRSPCTEEIAVFHAFSRLLRGGRDHHVVIDTAPSGHTLLLLDRTGSYHRDVLRTSTIDPSRIRTPLMRLQDPASTTVLLVALPETTPVHEAADLQSDLRRAGIEPYGWIINASLAASGTRDPTLRRRAALEQPLLDTVSRHLATRTWIVPWREISS
jgi:arsenite/tail-anchored protein-transporting ATPase